jgi:homoserine kinase
MKATVFAPGSVGNVGPGFDVLGLAVGGAGDTVTASVAAPASGAGRPGAAAPTQVVVRGRDAELIPTDPTKNAAAIAAHAMLHRLGRTDQIAMTIDKGLPMSGGIGGSAASSVAGAYAAALACGITPSHEDIILAALKGEEAVSGRHLDNIAPITLGGLALSRSIDPLDVIKLEVPDDWCVVLARPKVRIETKKARAILPKQWDLWTQQMANTAALIHAFATADGALARRALDDLYAEPRRASLIPHFDDIKRAALDAGAFGCSISGSGPTIFAIADHASAERCAAAMNIGDCEVRIAEIDRQGARPA